MRGVVTMVGHDNTTIPEEFIIACDSDPDAPLLNKYIEIFLRNEIIESASTDKRVLFYRGQADKGYTLTPNVFRKGLLEKEHTLIQDMLLNSPSDFNTIHNTLERLVKMQHYGLPTRLLDVTTNPLVAMYFACSEHPDKDGELFTFYEYMEQPNDLNAQLLAALTEYTGSTERQMIGFLSERGFANVALVTLTSIPFISIVAPRNNERIKRQCGAFIVTGLRGSTDGNPFQKVQFDLRPILIRDFGDGIPRSIIIPKDTKAKLLSELDAIGINQAFIYPELEHQAASIRLKHEEV